MGVAYIGVLAVVILPATSGIMIVHIGISPEFVLLASLPPSASACGYAIVVIVEWSIIKELPSRICTFGIHWHILTTAVTLCRLNHKVWDETFR